MKKATNYTALDDDYNGIVNKYDIQSFQNVVKTTPLQRIYKNAMEDEMTRIVINIVEHPHDAANTERFVKLAQKFYPSLDTDMIVKRIPKNIDFVQNKLLMESILRLYTVLNRHAEVVNEQKYAFRVPENVGEIYVASIFLYYMLGLNTLASNYLSNLLEVKRGKNQNLPIPITSDNTMQNILLFQYQKTYSIGTVATGNISVDLIKAMAYATIYHEYVFDNIFYGNQMTYEWSKQRETEMHVEPIVSIPTVPTPAATQPAQPITPSASQSGIVSQRNLLQTMETEKVTWDDVDFEFSQNTQSTAKTTLIPPVYVVPSQSQRSQRSQPRTGVPGNDERTVLEKKQDEVKLVRDEKRSHFMATKRVELVDKSMDLVETAILAEENKKYYERRHKEEEDRLTSIFREMEREEKRRPTQRYTRESNALTNARIARRTHDLSESYSKFNDKHMEIELIQ